jgi:hypothetical protein
MSSEGNLLKGYENELCKGLLEVEAAKALVRMGTEFFKLQPNVVDVADSAVG